MIKPCWKQDASSKGHRHQRKQKISSDFHVLVSRERLLRRFFDRYTNLKALDRIGLALILVTQICLIINRSKNHTTIYQSPKNPFTPHYESETTRSNLQKKIKEHQHRFIAQYMIIIALRERQKASDYMHDLLIQCITVVEGCVRNDDWSEKLSFFADFACIICNPKHAS